MASRIEHLAETIGDNTRKIGAHLRANHLPFPSFEPDGPVEPVLSDGEAEQARNAALSACLELFDLLQGPQMCLRPCYNGAPIQIILRYGIAQKVPRDGMVSFAELASACGMYVSDLRCVLRFAIVFHRCFREPEEGMVAHSAASKQLAQDADIRSGLRYMFDDGTFQSFGRVYEAIDSAKGLPKEPNQTGWALAHASKGSFFDDLEASPELADRFQGAMRFFARTTTGHSPQLLIDRYPWDQISAGSTVVDVGGGDGTVGRLLAAACPHLHIVVEDQAHVISLATTKESAGNGDDDKPANIEYRACDFFQTQAIQGAQVYLLRWILHDWPDNYAVKILQGLIPALKKGAKVVVNDYVGPGQAGKLPLLSERFVREMDMIMLSIHNTYEREIEDWQRIFKQADARFGQVKCTRLPMTLMAILEVEWEGEGVENKISN